MLAILFPSINPVIFQIDQLSVKWYGVAYVVGIIICLYCIEKLSLHRAKHYPHFAPLSKSQIDSLSLYAVAAIVLGGRIGYVLFYRPGWFISRPLMVLNTLEGGMSFHGALLGLIVALILFCRKNNLQFFALSDLICCVAPAGLFFGRIANFINAELYGRVTDVSWGVIFPHTDLLPRHPTQIYEALTEGILLLIVMLVLFYKSKLPSQTGKLTGLFLIGYSIARISVEEYREPDLHMGYFMLRVWNDYIQITMGQLLTLPMLLGGMILSRKKQTKST